MPDRKLSAVVFSYGVPLDEASSLKTVAEALGVIERERMPLVLCSGQTRAEIEAIQQDLGITQPFIAEHGAAVFVPKGYFGTAVSHATERAGYDVLEFGKPYEDIVDILHQTARKQRVDVVGFSDMSVQEVATDCGLSLMQARLAKLREYSESFRLLEPNATGRDRLFKGLRSAGLGCSAGQRYDHVGAPVDPSLGVQVLMNLFCDDAGAHVTVGLGRDMTDVPLLRRVDVPLIVDDGGTGVAWRVQREVPLARITAGCGAAGWANAIIESVLAIRELGKTAQLGLGLLPRRL